MIWVLKLPGKEIQPKTQMDHAWIKQMICVLWLSEKKKQPKTQMDYAKIKQMIWVLKLKSCLGTV